MSKIVESHVLKQFEIKREMGSGAYGHVWEVKQKKTNQIFALKKVFDAFRNAIDAQRTYREVQVLHKLKHQNVIKLHKVIKSRNNKDLYLIFQFMEADLHSVVGTNILEKMHQIYIFYQILKGIYYLHSAELIHRDLKPSNVLINSQCRAKLCDFGLIRSLNCQENQEVVLSEQVATKWYRAPELLLGSRSYGKPVDMWSFGCIVAQILTGKPLFTGNSTLNQFEKILQYTGELSKRDIMSLDSPVAQQLMSQIKIKKKQFKQYFNKVDPDFYELIEGALQFNPTRRITAEQALKLDLFHEFQNEPLIVTTEPVIPKINDNIRLPTKDYRQKIYEDIDKRYSSLPLKDRINELRSITPKREKEREKQRSTSKKRPQSVKRQLSDSIVKKSFSSNTIFGKAVHKYVGSPYFKSIIKHHSPEHSNNISKKSQKHESTYSNINKVYKKQQGCQSVKILKKVPKQKLSEMEKKNILKSIGVQKPKKLQKYLK